VVPVYNSEKYLVNCLTYLVNQTLPEIEIICVDDCSSDESPDILRDFASQFPDKVKVIRHEKNLGRGGARNTGIRAATGEYIGFVDSDDQISVDMYEKLYAKAKEDDYDIVDCAYHDQKSGSNLLVVGSDMTGTLDKAKRCALIDEVGYVYTKIMKRSLIIDNNVFFREGIIYEDVDFMCMLFLLAEKIANVEEVLYIYRCTEGSASKNFDDVDKSFYEFKELIIALYERLKDIKNFEQVRESIEQHIVKNYSYVIMGIIGDGEKAYKIDLKDELTQLSTIVTNITGKNYYKKPYMKNIEQSCIKFLKMNDKSSKKFLQEIREMDKILSR
ncbi:MAG: glycosyltransferase, partial [Firmicutes bacterium]|nr:glycosyltransferase [Bacillota bacterium]